MTSTTTTPTPNSAPPARAAHTESSITIIEPRKGWQAVHFGELWQYRELLYFLVWRDIKVRYKQTVLGAAWAIVQPVMTMIVFTIFFGKFGGMAEGSNVPYPILVFSALLPWTFFATSSSQGGSSLVSSAHLISKVYFPRLLIPMASLGAPLLDLAISFGVLCLMLAGYLFSGIEGIAISAQVALLPIFLVMTIVTAFGVGTFMSSLTIAYRDFRYVMGFLIQLWMFVSPVAYSLDVIPERFRLLYALNPMVGTIVGFRRCITGESIPWEVVGISACSSVLFLIIGVAFFRRVERSFSDLI